MPIAENDTLFNLIGTTYGGDGQTTFALPDLQGRIPLHQGSGFVIGQKAGEEQVTLITNQLPVHNHPPNAVAEPAGDSSSPANAVWAQGSQNANLYGPGPVTQAPANALNPGAIASAGGSQPHDNMSPFLVVNFIIALFGIYPTQT